MEEILRVINGEIDSVKVPRLALSEYIKYLDNLDFKEDSFESNGWQYDFWLYFSKGDSKYCLSGDAWYGETFKFYKEG